MRSPVQAAGATRLWRSRTPIDPESESPSARAGGSPSWGATHGLFGPARACSADPAGGVRMIGLGAMPRTDSEPERLGRGLKFPLVSGADAFGFYNKSRTQLLKGSLPTRLVLTPPLGQAA